jgi:hypothetical protein
MYSVDGPWSREEETELLRSYGFKRVESLDDVWELVPPARRAHKSLAVQRLWNG